jgi:hypothetical protein
LSVDSVTVPTLSYGIVEVRAGVSSDRGGLVPHLDTIVAAVGAVNAFRVVTDEQDFHRATI